MERIKQNPTEHQWWEDLFGLSVGVTVCCLGLLIYRDLGLTVGGTAGMALLLHYATDLSLGLSYWLINLPFYAFAWVKMGWKFTARTLLTVTGLSASVEWAAGMIEFGRMDPLLGTWLAGILVGLGLLAVFRHGSSFGGAGIRSVRFRFVCAGRGVLDVALGSAVVFDHLSFDFEHGGRRQSLAQTLCRPQLAGTKKAGILRCRPSRNSWGLTCVKHRNQFRFRRNKLSQLNADYSLAVLF